MNLNKLKKLWLKRMTEIVKKLTGKEKLEKFKAYYTFSGFGYGKHGVNEYYKKFFRYLGRSKDWPDTEIEETDIDVVSMKQYYFLRMRSVQ